MKRLTHLCVVAAMLAGAVVSVEGQSSFWTLVNGALRTTRAITTGSITSSGTITAASSIVSTAGGISATAGSLTAAAAQFIGFNGRSFFASAADGGVQVTTTATTSGLQDTFGADVTVTTCGTGSVTAGSKNGAGNITATGATACTVVFNTVPTFTNKPFCVVSPESGAVPTVVVNTTVSFTVTALTSGAAFNYICRGRI